VYILLVFLTRVYHDGRFRKCKNKNLVGRNPPQILLFSTVWGPPLTYRTVGAGGSARTLSGTLIDAHKYYKFPDYVTLRNTDCSEFYIHGFMH
jgi:hypothetical protein